MKKPNNTAAVLERAEAFMQAHPEKFEHVTEDEDEPVRIYWNTMGKRRAER